MNNTTKMTIVNGITSVVSAVTAITVSVYAGKAINSAIDKMAAELEPPKKGFFGRRKK